MKYFALIVLLISTGLGACTPAPAESAYPEVPRMPGSLEETGGETGFEFLVAASLGEVETFYVAQLQDSGWQYRGLGEGIGGVFLTFEKEQVFLEISAYRDREDPYARVVVRLNPSRTGTPPEG